MYLTQQSMQLNQLNNANQTITEYDSIWVKFRRKYAWSYSLWLELNQHFELISNFKWN